jgi:hypothetical protein
MFNFFKKKFTTAFSFLFKTLNNILKYLYGNSEIYRGDKKSIYVPYPTEDDFNNLDKSDKFLCKQSSKNSWLFKSCDAEREIYSTIDEIKKNKFIRRG